MGTERGISVKKLIELDEAIKVTWKDTGYTDPVNVMTAIRDRLEALPTVDAVPVRHGRWEWDGEAFVCSACGSGYKGQPTMMGEPMFEFCPVCGADMRKGGE